ncbi:winged helix-turn-helix domain-containing protein [Streptomyces sp. NPDC001407]|uniref:winged helix-turn-helix domain-containing protein n=1 Tax=Streptomyces sp. NPDC001407 TaxID=3364573 RepID=UPI00369A4F88
MEALPGLSVRARRLLLEGDVEGRYARRSAGDAGYALTMALAAAASQPGRAWTADLFYEALVLRPTVGGAWARSLRVRKSDEYVLAKLSSMLERARRFVGSSGEPVWCRADALAGVAAVREAVEGHRWTGSQGGVDEKNLAARLARCERAGGLEHDVSVRQLAEDMGCAKSTVEDSNLRLKAAGWLEWVRVARGKGSTSVWRLRIPPHPADPGEGAVACAAPGHKPAAGEWGAGGVPEMHGPRARRDSRALAAVMAHDAFHHWAHSGNGARLLSCLDPVDGMSVHDLAEATGLHRTTVKRRMNRLVDDHLAEVADDLYYLPRHLADDAGLRVDQEELERVAQEHGTDGLGERRRQRHVQQRASYQRYLEWCAERAARRYQPDRPRLRLVPEDVVDPRTGEVDPRWAGWDVSDPFRPVWTGDLALAPPGESAVVGEECA